MSRTSLEANSASEAAGNAGIELRVVDRVWESEAIVSLVLKPVDEARWVPFKAGQHLPIRLGLQRRAVATYTISSGPSEAGIYRISVKREPEGLGGSTFLHDAEVGVTLQALKPQSRFVLDDGSGPVVLLTGGVGITPAVSMLKELARSGERDVYFIHSARSRRDHAFRDEVATLAAGKANVRLFFSYSEAGPEDLEAGSCDHVGFIDRSVLRRVLPLDAYTVYCCGPDGFMTAMRQALVSLGVPSASILQEHFGPVPRPPCKAAGAAPAAPVAAATEDRVPVGFRRSSLTMPWTPAAGSLLDLAE